jgi:hypothetical protein
MIDVTPDDGDRRMHAVGRAIPFLLGLAVGCAANPSERSSLTGSNPAPEFALAAMNGEKLSLSGQRGKAVVLDFWGNMVSTLPGYIKALYCATLYQFE